MRAGNTVPTLPAAWGAGGLLRGSGGYSDAPFVWPRWQSAAPGRRLAAAGLTMRGTAAWVTTTGTARDRGFGARREVGGVARDSSRFFHREREGEPLCLSRLFMGIPPCRPAPLLPQRVPLWSLASGCSRRWGGAGRRVGADTRSPVHQVQRLRRGARGAGAVALFVSSPRPRRAKKEGRPPGHDGE